MTDPEFADVTYIEPLTIEFLEKDHRGGTTVRAASDARWSDGAQSLDGAQQGRHP
jgi:hypothetical protein